jgi:hypothetical protein
MRLNTPESSVAYLWNFGADPDPRIHTSDLWIRIRIRMQILILPFSSATFKTSTKKIFSPKFFCLLLFDVTFQSFYKEKSHKEVTKLQEPRFFFFLLLLLDCARIHTCDYRIRIQEAQNHPDPQHGKNFKLF